MKEIHKNFSYKVYKSLEYLDPIHGELIIQAKQAVNKSYAPYSKFQVGAALYLENQAYVQGANQENASYPLCMCAERVALYNAAILFPNKKIFALAVTAQTPQNKELKPIPPCGACRQVIAEFEKRQNHPIVVILKGTKPEVVVYSGVSDLLPENFNGDYLP